MSKHWIYTFPSPKQVIDVVVLKTQLSLVSSVPWQGLVVEIELESGQERAFRAGLHVSTAMVPEYFHDADSSTIL